MGVGVECAARLRLARVVWELDRSFWSAERFVGLRLVCWRKKRVCLREEEEDWGMHDGEEEEEEVLGL